MKVRTDKSELSNVKFTNPEEAENLNVRKKHLRCDQEWLSLLVTIKFSKFEIYHQRFIFVIA
jgi:hypothetical protein